VSGSGSGSRSVRVREKGQERQLKREGLWE
jgi:hypothetical protein